MIYIIHTSYFYKSSKISKHKKYQLYTQDYDKKNIDLLKKIKFLLKDEGMTINGVKKLLNKPDTIKLDVLRNKSIRGDILKNKVKRISNILKNIKSKTL